MDSLRCALGIHVHATHGVPLHVGLRPTRARHHSAHWHAGRGLEAKAAKLDAKLRASIAAGLNGVCSLFDDPKIREVFAPDPLWENFKGFDQLIEQGQIVALRVPKSQLKTVSTIVGTMTKLHFFDAVLNRLARAEHGSGDVGRGVFFVADEYDGYTTQPGGSATPPIRA